MTHWTIPYEIINQCLAFYYIKIVWDLKALNQENCPIIDRKHDGWLSIPINQCISVEICNVFEMSIKSIANTIGTKQAVFMGFVRDKSITIDSTQVIDVFCYGHNEHKSEAIKIFRKKVTLNDVNTKETRQLSREYEKGDTIKMVFNFKEDNCKWYFNEEIEPLVIRPLNGSNVFIPTFACYDKGCKYKITHYCFR